MRRGGGQVVLVLDHGQLLRGVRIYVCNGILFSHEGPRRGPTFVTRKISRAVVDITLGKQANGS